MALETDVKSKIGQIGHQVNSENPLEGLNRIQKLAALLVMLGPEIAVTILNEFDENDVEKITTEMAKLDFISIQLQDALLKEFSGITVEAVTSAAGGPKFAREVLERSLGSFKANELITRIAPTKIKSIDVSILRELQPRQLMNLLRKEQIQTWALVVSFLEPQRCAEVIEMLPPDMRAEIIERVAMMEPISTDVVSGVMEIIKNRMHMKAQQDFTSSGGAKALADIINTLPDQTSAQVLSTLEDRNPELAKQIKKLLFTFEDITDFDKPTLGKLLREVDFHQLAIALKTASERLRSMVLANLTKRAAESLEEEIKYMPPVRLSDVETAQEKIVETVRRLEAEGEIIINKKGGDKTV